MAYNLLKKGFDVTAYDLDSHVSAPLAEHGARIARTLDEAVDGSEVAIMMLPGPSEVQPVGSELLRRADALELLIDMSTSDPAVDEALTAQASARGVAYLDAPVSRAVQAAWAGELLIMVGGALDAFERARPLFEAIGSDVHHCGPVGAGHKMKLLNNLKIMAEVALIAEVFRLAKRDGMDVAAVNDVLSQSSAHSFMWDYQAGRMVSHDFVPGFSVRKGIKDLTLALTWAQRNGLSLPVGTAGLQAFQLAASMGLSELDTAALVSPKLDEMTDDRQGA